MATDGADTEFESLSNANYQKVSEKLQKMGYKDGMFDGRESQFQKGFDAGYEQGFQNGFVLGKYKARQNFNSTESNNATNSQNDLILQRSSRGQCVLCIDNALSNSSIDEIVQKQANHMVRINDTLKSRYDAK